ncbi:hypothetical protein CORC01_05938 [Colletotrichum orchidophilum]|uniref:Uncharacterized protein n=1 Tax=Colletotrichum orchidophilum TaxID=1209926 RepID=A0A1G4BBS4_9PEZI|nr:uncharacterized protein CORC01_05938 [Colletotrichum orchidophilum]OHE98849.1 hypothetical protein CORC01_05938 [Colletotrichum orchidophilum]
MWKLWSPKLGCAIPQVQWPDRFCRGVVLRGNHAQMLKAKARRWPWGRVEVQAGKVRDVGNSQKLCGESRSAIRLAMLFWFILPPLPNNKTAGACRPSTTTTTAANLNPRAFPPLICPCTDPQRAPLLAVAGISLGLSPWPA